MEARSQVFLSEKSIGYKEIQAVNKKLFFQDVWEQGKEREIQQ